MATTNVGKLFIVNKALCADKYTATLTSCTYSYLSTEEKTMQKTVLNDVFELLQQIGAVSSESEFSRDWLCRSECYVRTLRFKRVKPSVGIGYMCKQATALRTLYDGYRASRTACQTVH